MTKPRALVLGGKSGLLGQALVAELTRQGFHTDSTARPGKKAWDVAAMEKLFQQKAPDVIFNTWAYTQVDKAEDESEKARQVNGHLPEILGKAAGDLPLTLVHFSTDFVFSGLHEKPFTEKDDVSPQNVYGKTKLEGEEALTALGLDNLLIVRTAWLFGPGKDNFVQTMLDLAKTRSSIFVVHDQQSSPTYTPDLAAWSLALYKGGHTGLFHAVNSGRASWCDLATEAVHCAGYPCTVKPVSSEEYPQKAARPTYSVLSSAKFTKATGITPRPWVQAVQEYVYNKLLKSKETRKG